MEIIVKELWEIIKHNLANSILIFLLFCSMIFEFIIRLAKAIRK